jgi:hypothetical protein
MHAARISYARAGPAPPRPRSARRRMLGSSNTDSFQPAQRLAPVILDVEPSYQSHGAIIARFSGQPLGSSLSWRADSPPASWTPPTWRHQLQPRLHRAPYHRTPKCGPACYAANAGSSATARSHGAPTVCGARPIAATLRGEAGPRSGQGATSWPPSCRSACPVSRTSSTNSASMVGFHSLIRVFHLVSGRVRVTNTRHQPRSLIAQVVKQERRRIHSRSIKTSVVSRLMSQRATT